jgi:hypothetical protein
MAQSNRPLTTLREVVVLRVFTGTRPPISRFSYRLKCPDSGGRHGGPLKFGSLEELASFVTYFPPVVAGLTVTDT